VLPDATVTRASQAPILFPMPNISDLLVPPVETSIGGFKFSIRFDHRILLSIQNRLGKDLLAGQFSLSRASTLEIKVLLEELSGRRDLKPKNLKTLLNDLTRAWQQDMPQREPQAEGKGSSPESGDRSEGPRNWPEAWAIGRIVLGLSDAEWLSYTPRMTQVLSKLKLEVIRQNEFLLAQIAANVVNFGGMGTSKPIKVRDQMLHPWPEVPKTNEDLMKEFMTAGSLDPESYATAFEYLNEKVN